MNKSKLVNDIFNSVASRYDMMNDIMSLGFHRLWKKRMVDQMHIEKNAKILDVAGGTGDIAIRIIKKEPTSKITICDINKNMLDEGQSKTINLNKLNFSWVCADAENLPFVDYEFDHCTISFGIRNVSNRKKALSEMYRVLKKDGKFTCLEFSPMNYQSKIFSQLYDLYSFKIIPKIGDIIAQDRDAYEYLVNSIRAFPIQIDFKKEVENAGFNEVELYNMSHGIVTLYSGRK